MKRLLRGVIVLAGLATVAGCGGSTPTNPGDGGGGGGTVKDLTVFDIYLRPRAIQRAPQAGGLPNPQQPLYYLTAFFEGGSTNPTFTWELNASLGELIPKSPDLGTDVATVALLNDGKTPLGFYDIKATASAGGKTSSLTRRFAVIENSWQKHARATFVNAQDPPVPLIGWPVFAPTMAAGDEIFYVQAPTPLTINMRRINAFTSLSGAEQTPGTLFVPPPGLNGEQTQTAVEVTPDVSPVGMGYNEILFSSQMDPDFAARCPQPNCRERFPLRICLVSRPSGIVENQAKILTQDSTYIEFNQTRWYAFDFGQPRWNPTATGYPTTIAYISDLAGDGTGNIWLADLVDGNGDNRGDGLINHRQLTTFGRVNGFDWHPDGQSLYVASGRPAYVSSILKVSLANGTIEKQISFVKQDSLLVSPSGISVFQRPGEHTLVAFQANSEILTHLYVYDEDDDVLSRVSPYPFPVDTPLFPNWHPQKKWLTYVSDYSVNAWSTAVDPPPLINADFERHPRTRFPSVWVMKFED